MSRVYVDFRDEGDKACFRERLDQIIQSFPEMTMQSTHRQAFERICAATESLKEWCEVTVRCKVTGRLDGFMILTDDYDDHVGPVMGVQWCWIEPWAKLLPMHRAAREVARKSGMKVMAYTKRIGEGRYEINYVKV